MLERNDKTERSFTEGELLAGKYRVDRVIGEGGMGVVLAARHETLQTNVAIKLLRTSALERTGIVGRFMREAQAAVSLRSEHVARVFDVGHLEDGRPYIVMERLEGKDLGDLINEMPLLPIPEAVDYVMQACEAIAEAHGAGIVHRDLKPKNLFLTKGVHGRPLVKVLDFGISKMEPQPGWQEMQLTRTTEVIGSPSYMSPEQLRASRNVDTRTDIWALGVILYELLTGRLPFYAETVTELVLVIAAEQQPPLRSLRPDCPEGLEAIVARCLEKQPEHRFQSVLEFVQALEPYAHGAQPLMTVTERVRAVAAASGKQLPALPSSPAIGGMPANGPWGTSVAWSETRSMNDPAPPMAPAPRPATSRTGLPAKLLVGGVALALLAGGGVLYIVKRSPPLRQAPPPATVENPLPLPSGRKDLPPLASSDAPSPSATTPPPTAGLASPLPEARKSPPLATEKAATPPHPKKPTAPQLPSKPDDLSNIGRR